MKNIKKEKIGICGLCKKENVILEESHIIPKFVFKRIVKKSLSGFMRNPFNPNERIQDGDKQYLLCGDCEDLFNFSETLFANKVFHPYKNGNLKEFQYEKWLNDFITSVNWRTLYLDVLDYNINKSISYEKLNILNESEEILRDYLLGRRSDISNIENHIFFFEDIETVDQTIASAEPHSFFRHSSFGYTVICNDYDGYYVITNISGIILCTILKKSRIEKWENTLVTIGTGNFKIEKQKIESPVMGDLMDYMKESRRAQEKISKPQQDKIKNIIKKNPQKLVNSEIYQNKVLDQKLK